MDGKEETSGRYKNSVFLVNIWAQVVTGSEKYSQNVVTRPATLDSPGNFLETQILSLHPRHAKPRKTEGGAQQSIFRSPPGDCHACWCVRTVGTEEGSNKTSGSEKSFQRGCVWAELWGRHYPEQNVSGRTGLLFKTGKWEKVWVTTAVCANLCAGCATQVFSNSPPDWGSGVWYLLRWWYSTREDLKNIVSKVTELVHVRTRIRNQVDLPPWPTLCLLCHFTCHQPFHLCHRAVTKWAPVVGSYLSVSRTMLNMFLINLAFLPDKKSWWKIRIFSLNQ